MTNQFITKLKDYYNYQDLILFLKEQNTEKSQRMIEHINTLDQSNTFEFNRFIGTLENKNLLQAFV